MVCLKKNRNSNRFQEELFTGAGNPTPDALRTGQPLPERQPPPATEFFELTGFSHEPYFTDEQSLRDFLDEYRHKGRTEILQHLIGLTQAEDREANNNSPYWLH